MSEEQLDKFMVLLVAIVMGALASCLVVMFLSFAWGFIRM